MTSRRPEETPGKGELLTDSHAQEEIVSSDVAGYTRRFLLRVFAGLGVGELAHHITFGLTPGPSSVIGSLLQSDESVAEEEEGADTEAIDHAADQVIHEAEKHIEQGKNPNEAILLAIDLFGSANFFKGVRDLLPEKIGPVKIPGKPVGHINTTRYAVMLGLSALKYVASDETGRHHLEAETEASLKAFGIISGTIVAAEGLQLDLATAYEAIAKSQPDQKDKVAVMTLLGSLVSPAVTTVGSASLIRKMSNDLAKTGEKVENEKGETVDEVDTTFAAMAVSHISNLSGYLFFGDPPFIAVCEKFGFKEGVVWQMKTMWPLALASLVSSTIKLNLILAEREGLTGKEAYQKATRDAFEGLKTNLPVVIKLVAKSLANAAKYFSAGDLKWAQDPAGIQLQVGEVMMEKLNGLQHLFLNDAVPAHMHEEEHEGIVHNGSPAMKAVDSLIGNFLRESMAAATPEPIISEPTEGVEGGEVAPENSHQQLRKAIEEKDFDRVVELGNELGIPNIEILVTQWRDFSDNEKVDGSGESDHVQTVWDTLNPEKMFDRATNVDRIKGTMGHNLGDVINVFPFQAGSVPFLTPIFQKGVDALEGLNPTVKEMAIFFAIMVFSMFADNYVACKIGLELLPDKPQIALIAAIQGGSMTAIGNMANVAQYSLDDFPLAASLGKALWHADNIVLGLAWSQALGMLSQVGIGVPPTPKAAESHASLGGVGGQQDRTRRGFLGIFLGGNDQGPLSHA